MGLTTGGVHDEWTSEGHFLRYFGYPPIVSVDPALTGADGRHRSR